MSKQFSCNAFAGMDWAAYEQRQRQRIKDRIHAQGKEYILGVEETDYKEHLVSEYTIEPLEVLQHMEQIKQPTIQQRSVPNHFGRSVYRDTYVFNVQYAFRGNSELFAVKPSPWTVASYPIHVDSVNAIVSFEITIPNQDADEFRRKKDEAFNESFINVGHINENVRLWNEALPRWIASVFDQRKKHFAVENDFFTAINVSPNPETQAIFTVPTITRRVIPRPDVSTKKQFSREPTMSDEMYEDVLTILYQTGRAMERKPSLYRGKSEEDLRDQFLLFLETRYKATTGTGETFNKSGKTDILLKYEDGTNLFVAECKWWSGEVDFHSAIDQLFDRYLTWRDSKATLLLFVRNKGFSAVLEKVRSEATKHPYFVRGNPNRAETSLSFDFHLPNDSQRLVKFAVLLFAFPE